MLRPLNYENYIYKTSNESNKYLPVSITERAWIFQVPENTGSVKCQIACQSEQVIIRKCT